MELIDINFTMLFLLFQHRFILLSLTKATLLLFCIFYSFFGCSFILPLHLEWMRKAKEEKEQFRARRCTNQNRIMFRVHSENWISRSKKTQYECEQNIEEHFPIEFTLCGLLLFPIFFLAKTDKKETFVNINFHIWNIANYMRRSSNTKSNQNFWFVVMFRRVKDQTSWDFNSTWNFLVSITILAVAHQVYQKRYLSILFDVQLKWIKKQNEQNKNKNKSNEKRRESFGFRI